MVRCYKEYIIICLVFGYMYSAIFLQFATCNNYYFIDKSVPCMPNSHFKSFNFVALSRMFVFWMQKMTAI